MNRPPPPRFFRRALLAGGLALAAMSLPALAADYTWSPGGSPGSGDGIWSTSVANWTTNGGVDPVNWANGNVAIFGGVDGVPGEFGVAVAAGFSPSGITFNSSGYLIVSDDSLILRTINVGNNAITVAVGKLASIGGMVRIQSNNANLVGGGTFRVGTGGSMLNNSSGLGISGGSTLHIDGGSVQYANMSQASGNNTITLTSGTLIVSNNTIANGNGFVLADAAGTTSTFNLNGGILNTARVYRRAGTGNFNFHGGVLQLRSSAAETAGTSFFAPNNAFVKEGGAIIDSSGFNGFTAAVLQHGGVTAIDGGLTKNGEGRITLSGASTYTGTTTINAGSLLVNGSLGATAQVVVNASGTLGGAGSINAAVTINGTLAPGSSIETLHTDAVAFTDGSTLAVELDSSAPLGVQADLLVVNGGLDLNDEVALSLTDIAAIPVAFAAGTTFSLINYDGFWNSGLFTIDGNVIADGDIFTLGLNTWQLDYDDIIGGSNFVGDYLPDSHFVNIVAVIPEPSAVALLTSGLCAVTFFRRHRRRVS
jgi:fibronectin-binding autotransporter adhesin